MTDYIALVVFPERSTAYEAFSKISRTAQTGALSISAGAVVERNVNGTVEVAEHIDGFKGSGTAGGGLLGMVVGVLGGPLGMLFGLGVGALAGSLVDADRIDVGTEAIAEFGRTIAPGSNAILLETSEGTTDALDRVVRDLGGTIIRRESSEVLDELVAQQAAAEAAAKAAHEKIRDEKKAARKEQREERIAKLRARFQRD